MKNYQFKTNINCGSCVAKVRPLLDEREGIEKWQVDTTTKEKVLSVQTESLSDREIMETVEKAGFKAETI